MNKFKNDEKKLRDPFIEKSSNDDENNDVEVYNIKITPKILKNQRFMVSTLLSHIQNNNLHSKGDLHAKVFSINYVNISKTYCTVVQSEI